MMVILIIMMTKMTKKLTIILYSHLGMGGRPPALLSRLPLDNSDDDNDGCNDNFDNNDDKND